MIARLLVSCPDRPGIVAAVSRARALQWHCEDRVVRHGNTTVVF